MANLTIADAAAADGGTVSQGTKAVVDLSGGSIDGMLNKLYIGRDADTTDGGQATGKLIIGDGTLDVNDAYLGYQTGPGNGVGIGYCGGEVDVNGTALFRVNGTLVLGYTSVAALTPFAAQSGYGQLNIGGGTAEVNNITVGGLTDVSVENDITLTSGGNLIVTNAIGSASAPLNQLSIGDSSISIFANPSATNAYVTSLATTGSGGVIKVLSLTGASSYPVTIPVISYVNPTAAALSLDLSALGAGYYGYVVNNSGSKVVDAVITTNPPQNLVWNGNVNGNWDHSTANWQGGKTFVDGDQVAFDDTASGSTSVNVPNTVTLGSGGVLVTNNSKAYSLSGSGSIVGSALMTKDGTNSLTINAKSALALDLLKGSVSVGVSGTVGPITSATNTMLNNAGSIGELTGSAVVNNTGTVNGLDFSGNITNASGATINGTFLTEAGATAVIASGSTVNQGDVRAKVFEDSTLVMNGTWNNTSDRLEVRGLLTGSGSVYDNTSTEGSTDLGRITIAQTTSTFAPGGVNHIGTFYVGARLDLEKPPATMIIDVDMNNPQTNDVVNCDSFGNIRGIIEMNNIGSVPFAAGQSFRIYNINYGLWPNVPAITGATISPGVPGVGLQWDTTQLFTNGIVSVVTAPSTPPAITTSVANGTLTISWPADHIGYQLQVQTNSLATGLSNNWHSVTGSEDVTSWNVSIDSNAPAVFYRLSNQ
ncbi:MAG TPA: hypothetical protein VFF11_11285 [Candidatus Binatia bacterium]|nr:hypothetical protein [Candidatus Binatia bacterium]